MSKPGPLRHIVRSLALPRTMKLPWRSCTVNIRSRSSGLLVRPDVVFYFAWEPIGPKDFPLVSFRFHYRDWDVLRELGLVSCEAQRRLSKRHVSWPIAQDVCRIGEDKSGCLARGHGHEYSARTLWRPVTPTTIETGVALGLKMPGRT